MTSATIIIFCSLLLIAYLFDLSSSKTRIPSVILLLLLGWGVRQVVGFLEIKVPGFSPALPIFGTIGLILIVLEGALELEINRSKILLVRKSFVGALFSMLALALLLSWLLSSIEGYSFKNVLYNVIPLCVISSAIAIPSVGNLSSGDREFVIYESSLSDILGVIFFNFIALNESINFLSFGQFGFQLLVILVVSFVATIGLSFLLSKIEHHVKFVPIILLVILIYAVSKVYHLPGLLFILIFGLFIGNLDELRHIKWIDRLRPLVLNREVRKLKELTIEAAFLVRALFFLLFGYMLETAEILNAETLLWSLLIVALIFIIRVIQLKVSGYPLNPLLFVAPRGLITILLFLSIPATQALPLMNKSLVIQVIILSALIMMLGLIGAKKGKETLPSHQ